MAKRKASKKKRKLRSGPSSQKGAGQPRNYRREYDSYYGKKGQPPMWTALQKRHRNEKAARNRARRKFLSSILDKVLKRRDKKPTRQKRDSLYKKVKAQVKRVDIDHIDGNPLNNSAGNLRPLSRRQNRKMNGHR